MTGSNVFAMSFYDVAVTDDRNGGHPDDLDGVQSHWQRFQSHRRVSLSIQVRFDLQIRVGLRRGENVYHALRRLSESSPLLPTNQHQKQALPVVAAT